MPRYHFNLHDSGGYLPDEDGEELVDVETARAVALKGARSLMAAELIEGSLDLASRIEVADESGALLFTINFAEAVELRPFLADSRRVDRD